MSSLFAVQLKMEDTAGIEFPEGQLITEGGEGESVQAAVAAVTEEEAGIAEDERGMESLEADGETLEEVQDAVEVEAPKTEHAGLTQTNARLLKIVASRVLGKSYVNRKLPKMEHFAGRADARTATTLVAEGIGDALKSFWDALKAQFQKLWGKVKTWAIKTFSAAKQLADRAKTIRDRAESSTAAIEKKSFQFGQVKQLSVNGKLKSVSEFKTALGEVSKLVSATSNVESDKAIENAIEQMDKIADADGAGSTKSALIASIVTSKFDSITGGSQSDLSDAKLNEALGGGDKGDAEVKVGAILPGDKHFAVIKAKEGSDFVKTLRMTRVKFIDTKNKPKEVSGDAEAITLNPSDIAGFCDIIINAAGEMSDFENSWQKNDKAQDAAIRKIDELVKDALQDNKDDDNGSNKNEREIRTTATAMTSFIKAVGGIQPQVAAFAVPVFAATLNWCEGSMRNYKK